MRAPVRYFRPGRDGLITYPASNVNAAKDGRRMTGRSFSCFPAFLMFLRVPLERLRRVLHLDIGPFFP
jgi:hypothetical protein